MPWQNNGGGGPWGGGSSNDGRKGGGSPWGGGGRGGGSQPPDIEEMLRRSQDRMRSMLPGGFGGLRAIAIGALVLVVIWLLTGFYRVQPEQQGVVMTFGKWTATTSPGLNWHWPSPIQSVLTPSVTRENRVEVGYRTADGEQRGRSSSRDLVQERLMLTGDENIVDVGFTVLWVIKDAGQFLFNVRDPDTLIKVAAESVMREVVGRTQIQQAFTEGRGRIETDSLTQLQSLLDQFGAGIQVRQIQLQAVDPPTQVVDAFNEVQRARADRERLRNEAEAYRNDIIPRARGEAEQMLQEAQGYREEVVNRAQGDAKRFLSVLESYKANPDVTTKRIYLETMEQVLKNSQKTIIGNGVSGSGSGVVPYLPLPELKAKP